MSAPLRTLYWKIFLWFCLTAAISTAAVLAAAGVMGSQPFGKRWTAITQDLYARSAVDFAVTGGDASLQKYLAALQRNGIDGALFADDGRTLMRGNVTSTMQSMVQRAAANGSSVTHLGRVWTAASVVQRGGQTYIFVMEVHPMRGFVDGTFAYASAPRLLFGVALVALLCLGLARHITRPIRALENAAARLAGGDLSVRATPAMRGRQDELAGMATAFDTMAERIETLLRTEKQTLADISHELRSPLARINVSMELLRRGETDVLVPMQQDLERMDHMIGELLALARLELQTVEPQEEIVDVAEVAAEVVCSANLEGRALSKTVLLQSSLADPCNVRCERRLLISCLENIVRNALEYSPLGAEVRVHLMCDAQNVFVETVDSGPGVPEEALEQLFAPFYRVPQSRASHPAGMGLGLSIASRVAKRSGGSISARNSVPHGLIVTLRLPLVR